MLRISAAIRAALCVLVGVTMAARRAGAQTWDDPRTMALVDRATARRAAQLADSALADYHATAHGYLTFLAQLGEGFPDPPRVVRADELALQVYWRAPNLSKQVIEGRRDTLLLPTDIQYHRDHLGIVQNNFPNIIRLGEGDEVRDVPHPLSADGLHLYDFAIRDSLEIRMPDRTLDVYEVAVKPRDATQPRMAGAIYLDRGTAQVVRMAFQFTRSAYLDPELEDISIVLENALVDGRFWLPRRQEIEIRRTGRWMDFPARGIIRGHWDICCYQINTRIPLPMFSGPEIVEVPPLTARAYHWTGRILDSLPAGTEAPTPEDVRRVQQQVQQLIGTEALTRMATMGPAAHRVSDFARVNRVQGLALGGGVAVHPGPVLEGSVLARYGFSDHHVTGTVSAGTRAVQVYATRDYRELGDTPEGSLLVNSLASQEFGADHTDLYDVRGAGLSARLGRGLGLDWSAAGSYEEQGPAHGHATPWSGRYRPTVPAASIMEERLAVDADRPAVPFLGGTAHVHAQLRAGAFTGWRTAYRYGGNAFSRAYFELDTDHQLGADQLLTRTTFAAVGATHDIPPQEYVYLGGAVSGPGYDTHALVGRIGATEHVEWRTHVPFVPITLGSFGTAPASITLAPYVHAVYVSDGGAFGGEARGWYPSVGAGVLMVFDLVRFDVARGVRQGAGRWTFSFDVAPALWRVL